MLNICISTSKELFPSPYGFSILVIFPRVGICKRGLEQVFNPTRTDQLQLSLTLKPILWVERDQPLHSSSVSGICKLSPGQRSCFWLGTRHHCSSGRAGFLFLRLTSQMSEVRTYVFLFRLWKWLNREWFHPQKMSNFVKKKIWLSCVFTHLQAKHVLLPLR